MGTFIEIIAMTNQDNVAFDDHEVVNKILTDTVKAYHTKELNPIKFNYCRSVQSDISKIYSTLKTIQLVRILIAEEHPIIDKRKGSSIERNQFLRYNLENYFLRITTYKDQVLHAMNSLLQLEVNSGNNFTNRLKSKATQQNIPEVDLAIQNLDKLFSSVQHIRNKVAHEGGYDNIDLGMLELASIAKENFDIEAVSKSDYDTLHAMLIIENIKEMMQIEEDLTSNLYAVLRSFYPYYLAKIEQLDNVVAQ